MMEKKTVLLGVTGGIAAYKIPNLASMLKKSGYHVEVIMTKNACNFITPMTFETLTGNKCLVDTFDRNFKFEVEHIELAKKADICLIAPATANIIGKLANGIADDMLSTTVLACRCPILIAPAMNTRMYENPIVNDNMEKLKRYGFTFIEAESGYLACGDTGAGKMPQPERLFNHIERAIAYPKDLVGKKILITAGPTKEAIDPVRFITNHSTGTMGIEIARIAAYRGGDVDLVLGDTDVKPSEFVHTHRIVSAKDMYEKVLALAEDKDIIIKAAAVADYRPQSIATQKMKKKEDDLSIALERTDDILKTLGERKKDKQFLCGFSMETENMIENSKNKLINKNLDMIVANNLKQEGAGFGRETNIITMITRTGEEALPLMTKREAANRILDKILEEL